MDVHQESTVFCLFDPRAAKDRQFRTLTRPTRAEGFREVLEPLKGRCRVAFEVGTQAQWVAQIVRPLAAEVQVANPARIPWLFRDGRKNDQLDARKLATLLHLGQLPTVHLPSADVAAWRALIHHRRSLVKQRTQTKNQVRAILRTFALKCPHTSCWSRVGRTWLRSLIFDDARALMMTLLLARVDTLQRDLQQVERQLDALARTQPAVTLLRTIPGIGPRTAEALIAFTDEVSRFRDRKRYASYFGLTPTEDSSGRVQRFGRISKRGPSVVRWVLIEAVHRAIRCCAPIAAYYQRSYRGQRDRRKKAVVATARKVLTVCFAMLRDGTVFDERQFGGQTG
jgi:transposase